MMEQRLEDLLKLSHDLGREDRGMAILGEGNTSTKLSGETFLVKGSGSNLGGLTPAGVVECRFDKLLPLLKEENMSDAAVDEALFASRVDSNAKKPSVEALFHAYLLSLPGMEFIGHTHTISVNQILCSPYGRDFAENRIFPDEIVCCGVASVYVPYTDPGLKLSQAIKAETEKFIEEFDRPPRVILLENHGIIALGNSAAGVLATMLMADKAAKIFVGAATLTSDRPVFLSRENVERIAGRPDEHYRQKMLNL
jgi:rhamnose utilization protein RhaD (predicted bifunctional aldolase and dehydrogenase)